MVGTHCASRYNFFASLCLSWAKPSKKGLCPTTTYPPAPAKRGRGLSGHHAFSFRGASRSGALAPHHSLEWGASSRPPTAPFGGRFVNTQLPPLCACCEHRIAHRARGLPWDSLGRRAPADPEGDARDVVPVPTTGEARCAGVVPSGPFLLSTKGRWNKQEEGIQRIPSQSPRAPPCPLLGGGACPRRGGLPWERPQISCQTCSFVLASWPSQDEGIRRIRVFLKSCLINCRKRAYAIELFSA